MFDLSKTLGALRTATKPVAQALAEIQTKANEFVNGSITVDQTDPNHVVTTQTPNIADRINKVPQQAAVISSQEPAPAPTQTPTKEAPVQQNGFDVPTFTKGIVYNETRGATAVGIDPYTAVGPTGDIGKYQVSPASIKGWSEAWLGKAMTPEQFKADPKAQDEFFKQFTDVAQRLNLTQEQAAVAWHRGWGELGTGPKATRDQRFLEKLNKKMSEPKSVAYLNTYKQGTTTK